MKQMYCNREESAAQINIIFHLCRGDWTFSRENAGLRKGNKEGWGRVREVEIYKKKGKHWSVWSGHGFGNWCLSKSGFCPPTKAGDKGPIFRWWLEQTVNSSGHLELSQNVTWATVILEPGAVRNYASVCSGFLVWKVCPPYWPSWRLHWEEGSEEPELDPKESLCQW